MKPSKIINVKKPILKIRVASDGIIYILDVSNTIRIFDENFKLKGGSKIKMPAHKPFENTADISVNGSYLAIAEVKGKKTFIWDIKKKRMKYKFGWHKGEVLNVAFDWNEEYLLTGGMDGRAYVWSLKLGSMLLALPPHPDYILSGGFSKNNLWAATGSYDRLITITNISSVNLHYRKKVHRGAVNKIKFFSSKVMISGDKTGELIKWDFKKGKVLKRFENMADIVIDFVSDAKEEFLFAITKEKKVYLYDFKSGELITQEYIKLLEYPCTLEYNGNLNHLYVGCVDGSVYIYDLLKDEEQLKEYVLTKKYKEAYELVKQNPILKRSKEYKELESIWDKTINAIQKLLEKGEVEKAKAMFEPFKGEPIKRNMFQSLLKDYSEFEKFKNAVLNKRYPLAYSLVRKYPVFKESVYYKEMEKEFKKNFNKARELIKLGKVDMAQELLRPFRGVSEKAPLIQSLFNEKLLYDMFKNFLLKRDFKEFFEFVNRYPFLVDTEEYEKAMKYAEALYQKAEEAIKKGNYKEALKYAEVLKDFPMYREKAEELIKKAKNISNFLLYIANKDYDKVEELVDKYPYLEELEDYKKFMNEYKKMLHSGEVYAIKGDVASLKKLFAPFVNYSLFRSMVYQLIKRAYLNQIMSLFKKKELEKIARGIKNYIKLFGFDNEIGDLSKMAKKLGANFVIEDYEKSVDIPFSSLPDDITAVEL